MPVTSGFRASRYPRPSVVDQSPLPPYGERVSSDTAIAHRPAGLPPIKLSAPAHNGFWEIPVVYEDAHLLAIDKPAGLLTSPDRYDPDRPNLMKLLHGGIETGRPWAVARGLTYLSNAHRLDFETSGVLLLAKDRTALVGLADQFGSEKPAKVYVALSKGTPAEKEFEVDLKLKADDRQPGRMRWSKDGKKSLTRFRVLETFGGVSLIECHPLTGRTHQIRVHLLSAGLPILGDPVYGDGQRLYLSQLKTNYRPKGDEPERPLTPRMALHAWKLRVKHPVTGAHIDIEAPWPRDLEVALKYLRKYQ
ncbi:MAG: RluA family pseudouridine synthase [Verrucomicrobia bacterium]|nr:MAG: RluA family pseudouridine synthase [Verrucomicrobiota bacterium]